MPQRGPVGGPRLLQLARVQVVAADLAQVAGEDRAGEAAIDIVGVEPVDDVDDVEAHLEQP